MMSKWDENVGFDAFQQLQEALTSKVLSFSPGFSPVRQEGNDRVAVSTVSFGKTVKTVIKYLLPYTRLKPGENERSNFESKPLQDVYLIGGGNGAGKSTIARRRFRNIRLQIV